MRKIIVIVAAMLLCRAGYSQDYKADLLALSRNMLSQVNYSLQLHYQLFLDNNLTTPYQQRHVLISRHGSRLYMKQNEDLEVLETSRCKILINHHFRSFSAFTKQESVKAKYDKEEVFKAVASNMDSVIKACNKVEVLYNDDRVIRYECQLKDDQAISTLVVEIDKRLKLYKSITTRYREPQRTDSKSETLHQVTLRVDYKGFDTAATVSKDLFEESSYVVLNNNKITGPSKKLENYNYINKPN